MEKTSKRLKEDSKENLVAEIVGLNVRLENLKSQIQLRDKKIEELIEKKRDTYFLNIDHRGNCGGNIGVNISLFTIYF